VGIDPGRVNLLTAVEEVRGSPGKHRVLSLSRRSYYQHSGIFAGRRKQEAWAAGLRGPLEALSAASSKGLDAAAHAAYLQAFLQERERLWSEYSKARWARQRLRQYGGKRRTLDAFFGKLQAELGGPEGRSAPVTVAYGASSFAPGGRGELSVPVKWVLSECQRRFPTVLTDEFRTTAVCWRDGSVLQKVRSAATSQEVRGLLWCSSTKPGASGFVDRDKNAAINILRCHLAGPAGRPAALRRPAVPQRLVRVVGRTIAR
jgi:hypothetical protein